MNAPSCVVIGSGPAGAASALYLARAGVRVTVLEACSGPKTKACGEGMMPAGAQVLDDLGLTERALAHGARPFHGIRYRTPAGTSAVGRFPGWQRGVRGLAMRRTALDRLLREELTGEPAITVLEGWSVREALADGARVSGVRARHHATGEEATFEADLCVAADGLSSVFHRLPGVRTARPVRRRFGFSAHVRGLAGLSDVVEVHLIRGGEIYVTPVGPTEANIAIVVDEAWRPSALPEVFFDTLRAASPELAERCAGADRVDAVLARGPLGLTVSPTSGPGWMLAGDASGALDPITGEGIALALVTARALGVAVRNRGQLDLAACEAAQRARSRVMRELTILTSAVLFLARSPALSEAAVRLVRAMPALFERLLGVAAAGG